MNRAGLQMDSAKKLRILDWLSKNLSELNQFIGVIQYYRRFIPKLSEKLSCLNNLKKKNVKYVWTEVRKEALTLDPILRHPNFEEIFILLCDTSNVAIAGVLAQANEEDPNLFHPIFFGSKALNDT